MDNYNQGGRDQCYAMDNMQYGHFMVSTLHDILQDLGGGGGGGVQGCRILGVQLHGRLVLGGVMMRGCSISPAAASAQ